MSEWVEKKYKRPKDKHCNTVLFEWGGQSPTFNPTYNYEVFTAQYPMTIKRIQWTMRVWPGENGWPGLRVLLWAIGVQRKNDTLSLDSAATTTLGGYDILKTGSEKDIIASGVGYVYWIEGPIWEAEWWNPEGGYQLAYSNMWLSDKDAGHTKAQRKLQTGDSIRFLTTSSSAEKRDFGIVNITIWADM